MKNNLIKLPRFTKGQNTVSKLTSMPDASLRSAVNLDIDNRGLLSSRSGTVQVYSGVKCHSLFKNYFVENGILKSFDTSTFSMTEIFNGLDNNPVSYAIINDEIYFSSKKAHGIIDSFGRYRQWKATPTTPNSTFNADSLSLQQAHLTPLPLGDRLFEFKGLLYVVSGKILSYSDPNNYELTRAATNWFQYESDIKLVAPTEDGIYIATEQRTYFLSGQAPGDFSQRVVDHKGAFEGEPTIVNSADLGLEFDLRVPVWFSEDGFVAGLPTGQLQHLTQNKIAFKKEGRFVSYFQEENSIKKLIASLVDTTTSKYGAGDKAVISIIRNGVSV